MTDFFDIVVRRQIFVEGLKRKKAAEFSGVLADLNRLLRARLSLIEFDELGSMTKKALRQLILDLKVIARKVFDPWLKSLLRWLEEFCHTDADLLAGLYGDAAPGKDLSHDNRKLFAAAWARPLAATGTLALPFLIGFGASAVVKIERTVMQHYATRGTRNELLKALVGTTSNNGRDADILNAFSRQADAVSATVIQHLTANNGEALGKAVSQFYEWVSILDDRTTKICTSRNGNRYIVGKGPVPPAHINCRSTTCPVLSLTAGKLPDNFAEWLRGQSDDFVKEAFDGRRSSQYEGARAITLDQYRSKRQLIGA